MTNRSDLGRDLIKARIALLLRWPMFGRVILQLQPREVEWCATAATDGRCFYYNREFAASLKHTELVWLYGHEVLHVILDHVFRRGARDKRTWNAAADYLVNFVLGEMRIGTPIAGALYDSRFTDALTVDEIYQQLLASVKDVEEPIDVHLDNDDVQDGEADRPCLSQDEVDEIREDVRAALIQSLQQDGAGDLPVGIRRMIHGVLQPRIDWRSLLYGALRVDSDYSYRRLSRRYWCNGIVLPGHDEIEFVDAVACLDGSESTDHAMIRDFLAECKGIVQGYRNFRLLVMTFDTAVYSVVEYTPDNADDIDAYEFRGGGGTRPSCCWHYLQEHWILPDRLLVFTDGAVNGDWGIPDYCETIFIIHSNPEAIAPYGTTIHYENLS